MEELQELLRVERDVAFDHRNHRIMCFPHIVNICTGHIIAASTQDDEFDPLQDDPIKRVADFIRYIRSSYSRRESFARSVKLCIDDNPELEKNHPELNSPETKMGRPLELKLHVSRSHGHCLPLHKFSHDCLHTILASGLSTVRLLKPCDSH
jgi:hypothetical protein